MLGMKEAQYFSTLQLEIIYETLIFSKSFDSYSLRVQKNLNIKMMSI